jgi:hypothetical protein
MKRRRAAQMTLRMSEEEYQDFLRKGAGGKLTPFNNPLKHDVKQNKYRNKRVERNGFKFASIREADYYDELCVLRAAGVVKVIMRQVPFDLPGGIKYFADFCTVDKDGKFHVIDAKGAKTREYIIKKKQMKAIWGIDIEEV